jgi:hypothetical protein
VDAAVVIVMLVSTQQMDLKPLAVFVLVENTLILRCKRFAKVVQLAEPPMINEQHVILVQLESTNQVVSHVFLALLENSAVKEAQTVQSVIQDMKPLTLVQLVARYALLENISFKDKFNAASVLLVTSLMKVQPSLKDVRLVKSESTITLQGFPLARHVLFLQSLPKQQRHCMNVIVLKVFMEVLT